MLTLNDGRSELWQWDTNRELTVDADCSQVHFSNKVFGRSIDVDVVDGVAIIPDILLQTDKELTAWAFVGTAENGYTKISKTFKVNKRNKPADYVFTPQDQSTLGEILDRIEDLENRPSGDVSKEDIQNAVSDYLDKNPVSVEEKDPTVPAWAKQPEPPKVEIPEVDIPDALPNPHKLTFTGAVTAEYDGSQAVEVKIPEGGGGGIEVTGAEVGQTIVVKAVDENGKPTEWECAMIDPGFVGDCELIAFGTLSDGGGIMLDKDTNGNAFELSKAVLIISGEHSKNGLQRFAYNKKYDDGVEVDCKTTHNYTVFECRKNQSITVTAYSGYLMSSITKKVPKIVIDETGGVSLSYIIKENITSLHCFPWTGDSPWVAGTTYALYGVRV